MSDFKAKMHQIQFRLGFRPRPRWGRLQHSPDPLAGFKGPTSKEREGRERKGGEGDGEGRGLDGREGKGGGEGGEGGEKGGDVKGPGKWSAPGPALALGGPG